MKTTVGDFTVVNYRDCAVCDAVAVTSRILIDGTDFICSFVFRFSSLVVDRPWVKWRMRIRHMLSRLDELTCLLLDL